MITGIMSLKDSDDLLLVPEQIWAVTVGNYYVIATYVTVGY